MTWQAISGNPFFTVALPIVIALFLNGLWQNRRIDEVGKRIDEVGKRIDDLRSDMNTRFNAVDRRFDAMDRRFDATDRRLEKIETKLDGHSERISKLEGPALVRSGA